MTILFNSWFPDGGLFTDYAQYDGVGVVGGFPPPASVADHMELVTDPTGQRGTVGKFSALLTDADTFGKRFEILPFSPSNGDPITDWGGADADSRRWYRFAFMVPTWPRETTFTSTSQFSVVWQVHDDPDTSPADTAVEPPIWLKDDGRGYWEAWIAYDANTQTQFANRTYFRLARFPITLGKWEDMVVFAKWSWTAGEMKIWRDRRQIGGYRGPTCFNNTVGRGGGPNYSKLGVYQKTSSFDRSAYHCGTMIGDEAYATFDTFMAACGSIDTELEGFVTRGVSL